MRFFRRGLRLPSLFLLLLLMGASPMTGLVQGESTRESRRTEVVEHPTGPSPEDPSGAGVGARVGCLLCATAFLAAGGTTILGVAVTAIAFPELAAACGITCAYAFN